MKLALAIILITAISSVTHDVHEVNAGWLDETVTRLVNIDSEIDEVIKGNYNLKFTKVIKASLEFPSTLFN